MQLILSSLEIKLSGYGYSSTTLITNHILQKRLLRKTHMMSQETVMLHSNQSTWLCNC